jgi:hypothetical protein
MPMNFPTCPPIPVSMSLVTVYDAVRLPPRCGPPNCGEPKPPPNVGVGLTPKLGLD